MRMRMVMVAMERMVKIRLAWIRHRLVDNRTVYTLASKRSSSMKNNKYYTARWRPTTSLLLLLLLLLVELVGLKDYVEIR